MLRAVITALAAALIVRQSYSFSWGPSSMASRLHHGKIQRPLVRVASSAPERFPVRPGVEVSVDSRSSKVAGGRNLFLNQDDPSRRICYDAFYGTETVNVMVLPYLYTPKNQGIASNVEAWCRRNGHTYVCADYHGVSRSGGDISEGTVTRWTQDTIQLLEEVVQGKTILVGAAVGAWVMLRVALERPDLVAGLVGASCDPDFTEELLWKYLSEEDKNAIMDKGMHKITWGDTEYIVSKNLIEDGRENLVLDRGVGSLAIDCPVRLIHGYNDEEVPVDTAVRLMGALQTDDVHLTLLKGTRHFIDNEHEFNALRNAIEEVLDASDEYEFDLTSPGSG